MIQKKIIVMCGGKPYEFGSTQEAYDFFMDAVCSCDPQSSEAGRYLSIIQRIRNGNPYITDKD